MATKNKSRAARSAKKAMPPAVSALLPKVKKKARGKPFESGNPWRFPAGVSGNKSGKCKLLGESYAKLLAMEDPQTGLTYAELGARKLFEQVMNGDSVQALRELRIGTEGDDTFDVPVLVVVDR